MTAAGAPMTGWDDALAGLRPLLLLVARQHVGRAADAEDAVQDGVARLWSRGPDGVDDVKAYLVACVRSAAVDAGERAGRTRRREGGDLASDPPAPMLECPAERAESRAAVEAALARLPAEQREVVVLKVWGGLTFAEIAAATGSPPNTAASRYRYALAALRQHLSTGGLA